MSRVRIAPGGREGELGGWGGGEGEEKGEDKGGMPSLPFSMRMLYSETPSTSSRHKAMCMVLSGSSPDRLYMGCEAEDGYLYALSLGSYGAG